MYRKTPGLFDGMDLGDYCHLTGCGTYEASKAPRLHGCLHLHHTGLNRQVDGGLQWTTRKEETCGEIASSDALLQV